LSRILFFLLIKLLRLLPEKCTQYSGVLLGLLWYYIIPIRRKVVLSQMKNALDASYSNKQLHRLARRVFINLACNGIEFLRFDARRPEKTLKNIENVGLENHTKAALEGHGVLVLTAHFGNWDLLACAQALWGIPLTIVSKEIHPQWLNDYWMRTRSACGIEILPLRGSRARLLEALSEGRTVGFVFDQKMNGPHALKLPFMGIDCYTTPGLAELALDSGAPIVPVFMLRLPDGKHRVEIGTPLPVISNGDRQESVRQTTLLCQKTLEDMVRRYPEQWLWLHRRWAERR